MKSPKSSLNLRTQSSGRSRGKFVGSYRIIYQVDETSKVVAIVRSWHSALGAPEF